MAIIGKYPEILEFFKRSNDSESIVSYLNDAFEKGSVTNERLFNLPNDTFQKFEINNGYYAVEQQFVSKSRETCFFETHMQHIDIQVMIDGEEIIEVTHKSNLILKEDFSETRDLLTYHDYSETHKILLKKGDVAVFFPDDAHMGTQLYRSPVRCVKTVLKMPVKFFRL